MNNDNREDKQIQLTKCINCHGYGTLGFKRITCPTCKGKGVIRLEDLEKELNHEQ
jgi:DnaJ-class molecular chaperone